MDRPVKLDPSESGQVACTTCEKVFNAGDDVVIRDSETPSGQVPYCPACAKENPMSNANMKFKAAFGLTPATGRLKHLGSLGYLTLEDVENPGSSAPGGMNVQDWCLYRANWMAISKVLPEGGMEGEAAFVKEHPGEQYPGDIVYDHDHINIYKGAASAVAQATKIVQDLEQYPVFDEDLHSELEDRALEEQISSWAMDDTEREFGYRDGWEDSLTDEEAAWLAGLGESNPNELARIEKSASSIFEVSDADLGKFRRAVREGITYGDWTTVHYDQVRKVLEQEGVGHLADPAATLHQFLAKEMQASVPGSATDMKEKEAAGQQRLFESLRLAKDVVAGKSEIKRLAAAGVVVTKAKSVANMVAKIVGGMASVESAGGGFFTYPVKRRLMATLFKTHDDGSFGVSWAPMDMFKDEASAATMLAGHTMLSFDTTTKLRAISDLMVKVRAAGNRFGVWNNYDEIPAYPEPFATEEEAMAAATALKERFKDQGFYKTSDGHKVPYESLTVATHAENPDASFMVCPETDNPEAFNDIWGGDDDVEIEASKKRLGFRAKIKAKSVVGNPDDIGPATLRSWVRAQGYNAHAGANVLCASSRQRLSLWAKTPKGFESVVKELKHQKGIDNPWAVAWSMKNKGIKPKAAKVQASEPKPLEALFEVLKSEAFMGVDFEYPGFIALHDVPGMPANYFLYATPWFNDEREISLQLMDPTQEPIGGDEEALNGATFPAEDAPVEEQVLAFEKMLTERAPAIAAIAQADAAANPDKKPYGVEGRRIVAGADTVTFNYGVDKTSPSGRGDKGHRFIYFYTEQSVGEEAVAKLKQLVSDKLEWDGDDTTPGFTIDVPKDAYDTLYQVVSLMEVAFGAENVELNESGVGTEGTVTIKLGAQPAEAAS